VKAEGIGGCPSISSSRSESGQSSMERACVRPPGRAPATAPTVSDDSRVSVMTGSDDWKSWHKAAFLEGRVSGPGKGEYEGDCLWRLAWISDDWQCGHNQ
jgi:hypothetical protein